MYKAPKKYVRQTGFEETNYTIMVLVNMEGEMKEEEKTVIHFRPTCWVFKWPD